MRGQLISPKFNAEKENFELEKTFYFFFVKSVFEPRELYDYACYDIISPYLPKLLAVRRIGIHAWDPA